MLTEKAIVNAPQDILIIILVVKNVLTNVILAPDLLQIVLFAVM